MPEPKKRQSPVVGQNRLSKHTSENDQVIQPSETPDIPQESPIMKASTFKQEEVITENPVPLKDVMRSEPLLMPIVVDNYQGERDENGFYHGEGISYMHGGVMYKGTFKHGKMHGAGSLTWPNGVTYSGDFKENLITGKGLYVWLDGSTYEGDVFNGLRHGYGTFKCADKIKSYTGQWERGRRHGKGILYYDLSGESYYHGDWETDKKSGFGVRRFKNGNFYEGYWKNNIREGQGTMCWYDLGQEYTGHWSNGLQNGHGENIWYLRRIGNTQYPLRNYYVGEFMNGERHGGGVFYYASGAKYEGEWKNNMKHGQGVFTFKNGCVFRGEFSDDHMIDFPDLILSGMATPDISRSGIPVQSPASLRVESIMGIPTKATDVFLDVEIDELLMDYNYDLERRQDEVDNILRILLRYATHIKQVYKFYSCIGLDLSVDNTAVMNKLQYYRFLKDHGIHHYGYTLMDMDNYLGETNNVENCFKKIFLRDFLNFLIRVSYLLFKDAGDSSISFCFQKLLGVIFKTPNGDSSSTKIVNGCIFTSVEHSSEVNKHLSALLQVYYFFTQLYLNDEDDFALTQRHVMFIYKELDLLRGSISSTKLVQLLTSEENNDDGFFNLDKTISPLEFSEFLVASASYFVSKDIIKQQVMTGAIDDVILNLIKDSSHVTDLSGDVQPAFASKTDEVQEFRDSILRAEDSTTNGVSDQISNRQSNMASSQQSSMTSSQNKFPSKFNKKGKSENRSKDLSGSVSNNQKPKSKVEKKTSSVVKADESKSKANKADGASEAQTVSKEHSQLQHQVMMSTSVMSEPANSVTCGQSSVTGEGKCENEGIVAELSGNSNKEVSEVVSKAEDFEVWACKLNVFVEKYLLPAFEARKEQEELFNAKVLQEKLDDDVDSEGFDNMEG